MRDRAVPEGGGGLRGDEAEGRDPVRRAGLGARQGRAAGAARRSIEAGVPVLGICYGEQAMAQQLGGKVEGGHHREFGRAEVEVTEDTPLFEGVWKKGEKYPVWMSHGDRVTVLPAGLPRGRHLAECADRHDRRRGAQVLRHPVPSRSRCTRRTARRCCAISCARSRAARGDWTMRAFKDEAIEKIRKQVGKGRVICGLSGGVDSAVAAVLIHEAIGEQLTCVFVDHGLLRLDEAREGRRRCSAAATTSRWCTSTPRSMFLGALAGVDRPRSQAQDHRQAVHRRVRGRGEEDRRRRISWRRARSIPT